MFVDTKKKEIKMLNNNYKIILTICCLFVNNNSYSMEDDDNCFNLIKDYNIIQQSTNNLNTISNFNTVKNYNSIKDYNIAKNLDNIDKIGNSNKDEQIKQLSKQINNLSIQIEELNKEIYQNNQKNKFEDTLKNVYYLFKTYTFNIIDNIDENARNGIVSFLNGNFKKTKYNIANNDEQLQYLLYNEENETIKRLLNTNGISKQNNKNYILSKNIDNIDYFKCLNEINDIVLNSYYNIFETLQSNLKLLYKNVPLQGKNTVLQNRLQSIIIKVSKYLSSLKLIQEQYIKIKTNVLILISKDNIHSDTAEDDIQKRKLLDEREKDIRDLADLYNGTNSLVKDLQKIRFEIKNDWNNIKKYDFLVNTILKK